MLKKLEKHVSHWLILLIDVTLVIFSFILTYSIRFSSFNFETQKLLLQIPFVTIIASCIFWTLGSNRGIIRHTGIRDSINVTIATTVMSFTIFFIVAINYTFNIYPAFTIPKTIIIYHYFISTFALVVSRFAFKMLYNSINSTKENATRVVIYGAGDLGIITYSVLNKDPEKKYQIIGFVDDDKSKVGKQINRIKVLPRNVVDKDFVQKNNITEIIFAIEDISTERLLYLSDKAILVGLKPKIVPQIKKWINGKFDVNQIKKLNIEDLLNRKPISIDNPIIQRELAEKTVLVTGAAGSIGSEISRQIANNSAKQLILIDQAESALYDLQQELIRKKITNFIAIVSDVRNKVVMDKIFAKYKPDFVFHAAAYKHVPLMEENPYEAVKINVLGTKTIADLSVKYQVERFVMVSTDKAVNPTNVMGATKRVAEMYISCLSNEKHQTKFTTTRFGNVLGSNGSVIPLFKKQIEEGGPLTVTHKEITRYFMTIPEACQLVLEAGTMGNGGEIYIFDMGKSVKIFDIAKRMIVLSGFNYPNDIDIKITGLRPGEKLYEELLANGENTTPTYNKKIMIAKTSEIDVPKMKQEIINLCEENEKYDNFNSVRLIKNIVPEFHSNNSIYESLDKK